MAESSPSSSPSRWDSSRAADYDTRWKQMAEAGQDPHGEVAFVQRFEPASVLDAGCGTGRVATELAARGIEVVGTDIDAQMLAQAKAKAPEIDWIEADLSTLELGRTFEMVVMAGNIILFVVPGTEAAIVAGAARHVAPGGRLVAGFSLDRGVTADQWEWWLRAAGLEPQARHSTWDGTDFAEGSDYLVSISGRPV